MAGHSKWANIKRHKAKVDAKKGKIYTKLIREITVAARLGGGEAAANPRLRAALDKALQANMSREVIDRAIKRGVGGLEGSDLEEVRYEGYGPGGTAVLVECMTNNRNRTVAEVRHAFSKFGGNLGTDGSVAYLFKKQGQLTFAPIANEDQLLEIALEAGALDVISYEDKSMEVITEPEDFPRIKEVLHTAQFVPEEAEVIMRAGVNVTIENKEVGESIINLIDALEDLEDVQTVYSNANIVGD